MRYAAARQMSLFECGLDGAGVCGAAVPPEVVIEAVPAKKGRILIDEETGIRFDAPGRCAICGKESGGMHRHHVFFGTANRQLSEEDGMVVYLCPDCHEHGARAVHRNHETDVALKQAAQRAWMADRDADAEAFIKRYGRSWL